VSELELRLLALGRELDVPAAPDLAATVRERLEERPRRPFPWRRAAAVAVALVVVAGGVAFAVPQARTAILEWFHLGGASVERVEVLPPAVERAEAGGLGRRMSRARAERLLDFRLALPPLAGTRPPAVYVLDDSLATVIVRAYDRSLLLSQFRSPGGEVLKKLAVRKTTIEPVQVGGRPGLWLEGGPHTLTYLGRDLAFRERTVLIHGNVLLWVRNGVTLRLEGRLARAQALSLARRVR
jgi:hypothetical protein